MSTLFDSYYYSFGHELYLGSPVMIKTTGIFIYGHIVDMTMDNKGEKYTIIPDIGYKANKEIKLKKKYKVNWKNVYLININQK